MSFRRKPFAIKMKSFKEYLSILALILFLKIIWLSFCVIVVLQPSSGVEIVNVSFLFSDWQDSSSKERMTSFILAQRVSSWKEKHLNLYSTTIMINNIFSKIFQADRHMTVQECTYRRQQSFLSENIELLFSPCSVYM